MCISKINWHSFTRSLTKFWTFLTQHAENLSKISRLQQRNAKELGATRPKAAKTHESMRVKELRRRKVPTPEAPANPWKETAAAEEKRKKEKKTRKMSHKPLTSSRAYLSTRNSDENRKCWKILSIKRRWSLIAQLCYVPFEWMNEKNYYYEKLRWMQNCTSHCHFSMRFLTSSRVLNQQTRSRISHICRNSIREENCAISSIGSSTRNKKRYVTSQRRTKSIIGVCLWLCRPIFSRASILSTLSDSKLRASSTTMTLGNSKSRWNRNHRSSAFTRWR